MDEGVAGCEDGDVDGRGKARRVERVFGGEDFMQVGVTDASVLLAYR